MSDKEQALKNAIDFLTYAVNQPGHGVNTPLPRQLKQIIKLYFKGDGVAAIIAAEKQIAAKKGIRPVMAFDNSKKVQARRSRRSNLADVGKSGKITSAMLERMKRVNLRSLNQPTLAPPLSSEPTTKPKRVSAKKESVVADSPEQHQAITPEEVKDLNQMGAKEMLAAFGEARINATLKAINGEEFELKGSASQRANRLKHLILENETDNPKK